MVFGRLLVDRPNSLRVCGGWQFQVLLLIFIICSSFAEKFLPMTVNGGPTRDGELVLRGGGNGDGFKGNLLVYHDGKLWSVCDDHWNYQAAKVVCRSLGFSGNSSHTTQSFFGEPDQEFGLDDVDCIGNESSLLECSHSSFGIHDCDKREAAGVVCSNAPVTTTTTSASAARRKKAKARAGKGREFLMANELFVEAMQLDQPNSQRHKPNPYEVRILGGRLASEGRVEVEINGARGVICSDRWTQMEARVACRQAGLGLSRMPVKVNYFGGGNLPKLAAGIECDGEEERLSDCYHQQSGLGTSCPEANLVAGIICSTKLPDLVPNITLLEVSTYLQDRPMYYLQCAMEEKCASSSAFKIKATERDWHIFRRRLLRFSSSIWNFGTAPFLPSTRKDSWEWHLCHMHYHSMSTFAQYDVLDRNGNKVAEGHKASFCLEDVRCMPNVTKKYNCTGFGEQGISVGCADDYHHNIDCQWIDITDVKPGSYLFKVKVNPEYIVGELDFNNNAAVCDMQYTGLSVKISRCVLGRG